MRHDESGKLDVAKAAELLLKDIDHSALRNPKSDAVLLSRMAPEAAARLKSQHAKMIKEFRQHAAAICAVRGIPAPYVIDRTQDLKSRAVFEKALQHHVQTVTGDAYATSEIADIRMHYDYAVVSYGSGGHFLSRMVGQDWAVRLIIVPARIAVDERAFLVNGDPGEPREQGPQANERLKWGTFYHELGHILFPTAWRKKYREYTRQGRAKECPSQPPYDAANSELMADMMEMAFMTQCTGDTKEAKERVATRLLGCLRGDFEPYWNAPRLAVFLPKLADAAKLDNAGILSLLKKEFETCLWTEESFLSNINEQAAAKDWLKDNEPSAGDRAPSLLHIHDCVEAMCRLYKAEPAQVGIRPVRPLVPAFRPQM